MRIISSFTRYIITRSLANDKYLLCVYRGVRVCNVLSQLSCELLCVHFAQSSRCVWVSVGVWVRVLKSVEYVCAFSTRYSHSRTLALTHSHPLTLFYAFLAHSHFHFGPVGNVLNNGLVLLTIFKYVFVRACVRLCGFCWCICCTSICILQ